MAKRLLRIAGAYLAAALCTVAAPGHAVCQSGSTKALAFEKRDYVEIEGTKNFNLSAAFTVEMWVAWSTRERDRQYLREEVVVRWHRQLGPGAVGPDPLPQRDQLGRVRLGRQRDRRHGLGAERHALRRDAPNPV